MYVFISVRRSSVFATEDIDLIKTFRRPAYTLQLGNGWNAVMGGLEVLSKREGFDVGKEDAFWGFAGCSTSGGKSEDKEVDVVGEMHGSSDNMQMVSGREAKELYFHAL